MKKYFGNEQYLEKDFPYFGGRAMVFTFPNGYGASVVRHAFSYGGPEGFWEIAVLFHGDIVYDTPITYDVLGWQSDDDVEQVLQQIRELPA